MKTRWFGNTSQEVSIVGLGGEGILRTWGKESAAAGVIEEALAQGITYFDSARAYSGSESYYGKVWENRGDIRRNIFQTSKSAGRDKQQAMADLDTTLKTMRIDYLDLWQIHDVRTESDIDRIEGPNGALEAFVRARAEGKVRFVGVTGHYDPSVLTHAVRRWPVDAVLMPVNPVESILGGFSDDTLSEARRKGIAVIGMKVLGASYYLSPQAGLNASVLIRFALSQQVTAVVVGCSTPEEVRTLAKAAADYTPMPPEEQHQLIDLFRPVAGRLAFYRCSGGGVTE